MTRPLVYLAAPYTHGDPVANTHAVVTAATDLVRRGLCWPVVPHLSLLWHAITPLPYETWMAMDMALLARCDGVYRLLPDTPSPGADREIAEAHRRGIPVFTDRAALVTFCGGAA